MIMYLIKSRTNLKYINLKTLSEKSSLEFLLTQTGGDIYKHTFTNTGHVHSHDAHTQICILCPQKGNFMQMAVKTVMKNVAMKTAMQMASEDSDEEGCNEDSNADGW